MALSAGRVYHSVSAPAGAWPPAAPLSGGTAASVLVGEMKAASRSAAQTKIIIKPVYTKTAISW